MNKIPQKKKSILAKKRGGTTLVEVMLAVIVIAILAILATTALFYPTHLVVSDARRQVALLEANAEMENVASMSYNDPNLFTTNYSITALNKPLGLLRDVDDSSGSNKVVTITVTNEIGDLIVELVTEKLL